MTFVQLSARLKNFSRGWLLVLSIKEGLVECATVCVKSVVILTCTRDLNAARGTEPSALLRHETPLHLGSYGAYGPVHISDYPYFIQKLSGYYLDDIQINLSWIE